ncbi:MAG TPA: CARDB domain-containing protein [Tepidisphaeraceae bacterium]|jgi:uncharacterized delta-60 repeat protein|nr:CARDB domain-containing protein [Tepidisphaeraceae bacterium]
MRWHSRLRQITGSKLRQSIPIERFSRIEALESRTLLSAGFLSSSFGTNGTVSLKIGSKTNDAASSVATSTGQLLVVGDAVTGSAQSGFITRLDSDGTTDASFGASGISTFRFGANTVPTGVAIDPTTGDAVVCGVIGSGLSGQGFIAKFDTSGNLITSFGTNGFVSFAPPNSSAEASGVVVNSVGGIAVGGTSISGSGVGMMIALFNSDGSPFNSLGGTGINVFLPDNGDVAVGTGIVQDQGHWIVPGFEANLVTGQMTFAVVAFNVDTSVAVGFGNNGEATASFGNHNEAALKAVVDPTTHDIFAAGATSNGAIALLPGLPAQGDKGHATFGDFAVADFTDTGTLNTAFNGTGMQTVAIPAGKLAGASGIVEQTDGKFVLGGSAETGSKTADVAFARLNADGSLDTSFGNDGTSTADLGGSAGAFFVIGDNVEGDFLLAFGGHNKVTSNNGTAVVGELSSDSSPETSNPGPTPTLTPSVSAKFPAAALSGAKATGFSASAEITNSGSGPASGAATLDVYFSTTPVLDTSTATLADMVNLKLKLAPGKSLKVPIHLKTFPSGLSGSYYVLTQVSGGGTSSAANAASSTTGNVAPAFQNLVNEGVTDKAVTIVRGKSKLMLTAVVENAGNVAASGPFALSVGLATDQTLASETTVGTINTPLNLAPGKKKTIHISLVVPTTLAAGTYFPAVTVDPQNTFAETSLSDNTAAAANAITAT